MVICCIFTLNLRSQLNPLNSTVKNHAKSYSNGSPVSGNWGGRTPSTRSWNSGFWFNRFWPCNYDAVMSGQIQYPGCQPTNQQTGAESSNQNGIIFTNGAVVPEGNVGIITTNGNRPDTYLQANQVLVSKGPLSAVNFLEQSLGK